jgi:hypothetical protein
MNRPAKDRAPGAAALHPDSHLGKGERLILNPRPPAGRDHDNQAQHDNTPAPAAQTAYKVVKREKDRWWEVRDPQDELVCVTVSMHGAVEVVRRLAA